MKSSSDRLGRFGVAAALVIMLIAPVAADDAAPRCYGPENYATQSALVQLVNRGHVADMSAVYGDDQTPYGLKTRLLDSQPSGHFSGPGLAVADVYRQIQKIEVHTQAGAAFTLLTISEVSAAECALSAPTVVMIAPTYEVLYVGEGVQGAAQN